MKHRLPALILILQFLLLTFIAHGQHCAIGGGGFKVTPPVGCVGEKVTVQNLVAGSANVAYSFNFNPKQTNSPDSTDLTRQAEHVYASAGSYTILQQGSHNSEAFTSCQDYTVKETRPLKGTLIACENNVVRLTVFNDSISRSYDRIYVDWGNNEQPEVLLLPTSTNLVVSHSYQSNAVPTVTIKGQFVNLACASAAKETIISSPSPPSPLTTIRILSVEMAANGTAKIIYQGMEDIPTEVLVAEANGAFVNTQKGTSSGGIQTVTIGNLDPTKPYRFKLQSRNACENLVESGVVGNMVLRVEITTADEVNSLAWDPYFNSGELVEYQLIRNAAVVHTTNNLGYLDNSVKCGNQYEYVLVAIIQNDVRSYSAPVTAEPKTGAPETISNASVTVTGNNEIETKVALGGLGLTSTFDLVIERATGNGLWERVSQSINNSLIFRDQKVNTSANSYCYRFSYTNACKLSSPAFSPKVCSILLTGKGTTLNWTDETPFSGNVGSYDVIEMDKDENVTAEISSGLQVAYEVDVNDDAATTFQIKAYSETGNFVSLSNRLFFVRDAILLIPDAFTPNNDNRNDIFMVKSHFAETFSLSIYNRWGTLVFHSTTPNDGWDGKIGIEPASAGYYIYKVKIKDSHGRESKREGGFLLIR
jgi:gliding motility-associated-like protein